MGEKIAATLLALSGAALFGAALFLLAKPRQGNARHVTDEEHEANLVRAIKSIA